MNGYQSSAKPFSESELPRARGHSTDTRHSTWVSRGSEPPRTRKIRAGLAHADERVDRCCRRREPECRTRRKVRRTDGARRLETQWQRDKGPIEEASHNEVIRSTSSRSV